MTSYKTQRINLSDDVYRASCKEGPTSRFIHLEMQVEDLETHQGTGNQLAVGTTAEEPR